MKALILAQLQGFATHSLMLVIAELVKFLQGRGDSSVDKDGDVILKLLKKNAKEDRQAGKTKKRSYYNNANK